VEHSGGGTAQGGNFWVLQKVASACVKIEDRTPPASRRGETLEKYTAGCLLTADAAGRDSAALWSKFGGQKQYFSRKREGT